MTHERRLAFGSGGNPDTSNLVFFSVDSLSHNQTLDGGVITQVEAITGDGLRQNQVLDEAVMTLEGGLPTGGTLFPDDLSHVQVLDGGVITQVEIMGGDGIQQTQTVDGAVFANVFAPQAIEQTQVANTAGLDQGIFGMDGPSQVQALDTAGLVFIQHFSPTDLTQVQELAEDAFLIAVANTTTVIQSTGSTSVVLPVPNGKLDGDRLIAFIGTGNASENHTAPAAWTPMFEDQTNGGHTFSGFQRLASSEPENYTFSWVDTVKSVATMLLVKGVDTQVSPTSIVLGGNNRIPIGGNITPTKTDALLVSVNSHDQGGGRFLTVTEPPNMNSEVAIQAGPQHGIGIQVTSEILSTASGTKTWGMTKKEQWLTANIIVESDAPHIPTSLNQVQTIDGSTITQLEVLSPDGLTQTQTLDGSTISLGGSGFNLEGSTSDRILLEDGFVMLQE